MMLSIFIEDVNLMPKRYRHLIEDQPKIKVIAQAHDASNDTAWFVVLAAVVAGAFYFFSYYCGGDLWRVLAGG
jgi:hypothetical protein